MSAVARFFNQMGKRVYGYDKTPSPLTNSLIGEGIQISYVDSPSELPGEILDNPDKVLVVYTPAIPQTNQLKEFFEKHKYEQLKRSEVLGMITEDTVNLSVSGTHGKTTTSCMLAAIFKQSSLRFTAFLGGISADLESNYYHQEGEGSHFTITEADEYDRSFLRLTPSCTVVTSTDADHLDIYGEADEVKRSFAEFCDKIEDKDKVFIAHGKTEGLEGMTYSGSNPDAHYWAKTIEYDHRGTTFHLMEGSERLISDLYLNIPGVHNLENAVGASLLALKAGIDQEDIRTALKKFKGIKRRFEYILDQPGLVFIDDYAHHPSEIDSILSSVKRIYPEKHITVVFQPHLYTRTRDFAAGFADSLSVADRVILLPIYPAREEPIKGVESAIILNLMTGDDRQLIEKQDLLLFLKDRPLEVLLTLGAGDIDRLVLPIKDTLNG